MVKTVAVIGAGASGLPAIKCCLEEGLQPVCFERRGAIGGLWNFTEDSVEGLGCVSRSTVINTSKEMSCFSDFPAPKEFPNFMPHQKVVEYFNMYADHFDLKKHIRFYTGVRSVKRAKDFDETGRWEFEVEDIKSGRVTTEFYDAVLVCSGHHTDEYIPQFPGFEKFRGEWMHSHRYKGIRGYEGKRIVVIGNGNSGGDAACDLSRVAAQVFQSARRGTWVLHRIDDNGIPFDMIGTRRIMYKINSWLPNSYVNSQIEAKLNSRFDHQKYGIKPEHRVLEQHPTINDDLPYRIANGTVIIKPIVKRFTETGVEFEDGSFEDNIDLVFFGTGYSFGFPFIEKSVIEVKNNVQNLYRHTFVPDLKHPTMAIIGFLQPNRAINPIFELQCRWATRVFNGLCKLPSSKEMWADINRKNEQRAKNYVISQRHTVEEDWMPFIDGLAENVGCKPNFLKLFLTDPKLGWECFNGPVTAFQYRLHGPGTWKGARQAIMTQWDRAYYPLNPKDVARPRGSGLCTYIFQLGMIAVFAWLIKMYFRM